MSEKGFCKAIKQIRLEEKLTLAQFSKRSGINQGQLSQIENGHFPGRIQTLKKLQKGLNITNNRMLNLLGFRNTEYRNVPVISSHVKNFGEALANAHYLSFIANSVPEEGFVVIANDAMPPSILKGSRALVNRDFSFVNGDMYAVLLDNDIIIGRIYKNKSENFGVLITANNVYFNIDYMGRYQILGHVDRVIDKVK